MQATKFSTEMLPYIYLLSLGFPFPLHHLLLLSPSFSFAFELGKFNARMRFTKAVALALAGLATPILTSPLQYNKTEEVLLAALAEDHAYLRLTAGATSPERVVVGRDVKEDKAVFDEVKLATMPSGDAILTSHRLSPKSSSLSITSSTLSRESTLIQITVTAAPTSRAVLSSSQSTRQSPPYCIRKQ